MCSPIVILVHGGAWLWGNPNSMSQTAVEIHKKTGLTTSTVTYGQSQLDTYLVQKTLCTAILSFTTLIVAIKSARVVLMIILVVLMIMLTTIIVVTDNAQTNTHPAHVIDVVTGIQTVLDTTGTDKFILVGHSAGAHLVSLISTDHSYLVEAGINPDRLVGMIGLSGIYSDDVLHNSIGALIESSVFDRTLPAAPPDAFAVNHCGDHVKCAVFIACTGGDFSIIKHSHELVKGLEEVGVRVHYKCYRDLTHFSIKNDARVVEDVVDFIVKIKT